MPILLPVNESDDYVELTSLPEDADEVLELLRMELVPLRMWLLVLSEYAKKRDVVNFKKILEASADPDIQSVAAYSSETTDQLSLLAIASSNLCIEALLSQDSQAQQNLFQSAREIHNRADGLALLDARTWVSKGNYHIASFMCFKDPEELLRALKMFQYAIDDAKLARPTASQTAAAASAASNAARQGRAGALFLQKSYRASLEEFRAVLKSCGSVACPGNVRIGIAACQFKLGRHDKALEALQAALEVDPEDPRALTALSGFLPLLDRNGQSGLAAEACAKALDSFPDDPAALIVLSAHCLVRGDFESAHHAARLSLNKPALHLKSLCHLMLASAVHGKGDFQLALKLYQSCGGDAAAQLGAAKCSVALGQYDQAATAINAVKLKYPNALDVIKVEAYVSAVSQQKPMDAAALRSKATAAGVSPDEDKVLLMLTANSLLAAGECTQASESLAKLKELYPSDDNNQDAIEVTRATLAASSGDYPTAELLLSSVRDPSLAELVEYNRGQLRLLSGDVAAATTIFSGIVSSSRTEWSEPAVCAALQLYAIDKDAIAPDVLDSIAESAHGDFAAVWLIQSKLAEQPLSADTLAEALKSLQRRKANDAYTCTFTGDLHLKRANSLPLGSSDEEKHLDSALKYFQRAIDANPQNYFALVGAASVLATKDRKPQALDLFRGLAEHKFPTGEWSVQLGLGHLYLEEQLKHIRGVSDPSVLQEVLRRPIKAYESALKLSLASSCHSQVIESLHALASCLFLAARFEEAAESFADALALEPENVSTRYNLALSLENAGAHCLLDVQKQNSPVKIADAVKMLQSALQLLQSFKLDDPAMPAYLTEKLNGPGGLADHVEYCRTTAEKSSQWLSKLQENQLTEQFRLAEAERVRREREEADRKRKIEMIERERAERESREIEADARMEGIKQQMLQPQPEEPEKETRKPAKAKKRLSKKKKATSSRSSDSSSSSSSSSSGSSSGSSSSDSSSSDSDSSSASESGVKRVKRATVQDHDTVMAELFGE